MGCLANFAKYIIFFFNFIIEVCAIVLITFGVIILVNEGNGVDVFDSFSVGGFAIGVGVIIFFIAFLGCCGAIRENTCLLLTYAFVLIALFVTQATLGILAIVNLKDRDVFRQKIYDLVEDLYVRNSSAVDALQSTFECCGIDGPGYYENLPSFPKSCCQDETDPCYQPFQDGCATTFADIVANNLEIIGYVAIAFAVVELLGAIFAFLVRNKRKEYV